MEYTGHARDDMHPESVKLSEESLLRCTRKARREGVLAGITSGFLGGLTGMRLFRFDRKKTLFCAILTTALSGYYFTQAITSTHIAKARAEEMRLRQNKTSEFIPDGISTATVHTISNDVAIKMALTELNSFPIVSSKC
ncbi:hypothetical protein PNOK_0164100 [Pyrrhoderma noxium]|uniref:Uncharacterized protein n=1 Tax=Pyrrhoderma noxium TaxID=2282107 RepID=A0A286UQ89_9AGAM|nr:hypothetical protein PNOK_0164100 [Pyrrhoderma noxium]